MIVKVDGKEIGNPIFDMSYLRNLLLELIEDKEMLHLNGKKFGYAKSVTVKPNLVRIKTTMNHVICYEEI